MNKFKQFWVMVGECLDISYSTLIRGTDRLAGPYSSSCEVFDAWRALVVTTTAAANVRFSIVEEPVKRPNAVFS